MYDWSISIFRARISPTVPRGSCVMASNVTLRGVMVQIVSITGVH
jgi:hypothetical protein